MNYTKSGIVAVGAPNSRARYTGEVAQGLASPALLLLTDEGNALADRFFLSVGCTPSKMSSETRAGVLMEHEHGKLFAFLTGASFALSLI